MSVFLKCGSWERKLYDNSQFDGTCSKFYKKYEGPIFLVLSIVFAVLTALVAYGYIPPFGGVTSSLFNVGFTTAFGVVMTVLCFHMGVTRTLQSQGCIIVRKDPNADSIEQLP